MRFKRLLSAALAAALTASLVTVPASAAAFRDLSALPQVSDAAEFLRLVEVVNGVPGGNFNPEGTLSRAEFCKMAVCALDRADDEPAQRGRTIYLDVGPDFWATGYINLASIITLGDGQEGSGTPLVAGVGDGTFQPNRPITYGEAVAILCRVLGYGVDDVSTGGAWYDGYLSTGASVGLTDSLALGGGDVITRAQAAILFYNLYFAKPKGSEKTYLVTLGGSEVEGSVILDVDYTADDGTPGAVKTTKDVYKTDRDFSSSLVGQEGKVLLDKDEKLLAFLPKEGTTQRVYNVTSTQATYLMASGGEKLTVEPETKVYQEGKETTWEASYQKINSAAPVPVTFHYNASGKLAYLFVSTDNEDGPTAMVARSNPSGTNPFASLAGQGSYTMFKNGVPATATDIRQYDAATFDPATRVIQVSDLKLSGIYEDASPSPAAPITVKLMGHSFPVLPSARKDLNAFRVGDKITLLLTADNQVAGVVSADVVKGDAVGIAAIDGTSAKVKLLQGGLEVTGSTFSSAAKYFNNQLVSVTSNSAGWLSFSNVTSSRVSGSLDVSARKLGEREVAENVVVYDRVESGNAVEVPYKDLALTSVPRDKITFVSYDYAGRVKCLVLDDVTGDAYQYGYFSYVSADQDADEQAKVCVRQGGADGGEVRTSQGDYDGSVRLDAPGGAAYAADGSIAATVYLQTLTGVKRAAFDPDEMTVTVAGVAYPISKDVQCYNATTKTWFTPGKEGMEAIRAYSDTLTLYYDRSPAEGGRIRLITVP